MKNSINLNFGLHHLHTVFTGILWFTVQNPVPVVAGLAEVAALVPLFTAQIITGPLGGIMAMEVQLLQVNVIPVANLVVLL